MTNTLMLVGRLTKTPLIDYTGANKDKKYAKIQLAVTREYKNVDGIYETDFIDCLIFGNIAETTCEYCVEGDLIGIRGRIETRYNDNNDRYMIIVADRISFLSSAKRK